MKKTSKFGKLQRLLMAEVNRAGGCQLARLHALAFPSHTYSFSYIIPVVLRMEHQGLIKVKWDLRCVAASVAFPKQKVKETDEDQV